MQHGDVFVDLDDDAEDCCVFIVLHPRAHEDIVKYE